MIIANGEVQTSEEVQVYVRDLELFVTVQILDDTPAVLLLGKLCEEDDGYTSEWASGQKPQLTKNGKICARQKISFLLLQQGCLQARAQVRLRHRYCRTHRAPLRVQQEYEVTTVTIKHQETEAVLQTSQTIVIKRDDNQATRSRLRDLPEWLQEFTFVDTEVPAPAHISQVSVSERPTKVALRKHKVCTHISKDRN